MKLHLLHKMLLFILLPAMLGLCAVAGISYWRAETALSAQIAEELTLVVESRSGELENVTNMLRSVLKTAARWLAPGVISLPKARARPRRIWTPFCSACRPH